ncbi:hypothetical protein NE562_05745 [Butyricicoccus faecihominis]|uniref:hypothetical protein n=1 Tax=Butyricicoccus faecihominis TaxID=1712515 RepID=UPI00247A4D0C|nr:hypothetical protein [Butyricicoccus faecihominis]MCQ5129156.1 hypothetical protein [Butyricicoccus faecihominis]
MTRYKKLFALTLILGFTLIVPSFAATINGGYSNVTTMIGLNDYGWTAFDITAKLAETYEKESTRVKYSSRLADVEILCSRPDNGATLTVLPIPRHYDRSTNKTVKSFSMYNESTYLPGNISQWYVKRNSDVVYYSASNNYACGYGFSLYADGCINPYADTITVNLSV